MGAVGLLHGAGFSCLTPRESPPPARPFLRGSFFSHFCSFEPHSFLPHPSSFLPQLSPPPDHCRPLLQLSFLVQSSLCPQLLLLLLSFFCAQSPLPRQSSWRGESQLFFFHSSFFQLLSSFLQGEACHVSLLLLRSKEDAWPSTATALGFSATST